VRGLDLSTSDGDGHAVVVLYEEPGMTGAAAALAAAAAAVTGEFRDPPVPGVPVDLVLQAAASRTTANHLLGALMIILGVILLIIGFVAGIAILWTIGIIVVVVGVALALLGMAGHAVGGRRHYY
jgi:hypothetical protein